MKLSTKIEQIYLNKKEKNKTENKDPLVMATKYNPCLKKIKARISKYWHLLNLDDDCKNIFTETPMIAFKKHKNLGDNLPSAKLK